MNYDPRRWQGFGETPPVTGQPGPMTQKEKPRVQYLRDWFTYGPTGTQLLNLAPAATAIVNIQIDADSDFVHVKSTAKAFTHGSDTLLTLDAVNATVLMIDSGSGRQLMNTPIQLNEIFGTGALPFVLPQPRIYKARSNIQLTVLNGSAGTTYDIYLALSGRKVFGQGIPEGGFYPEAYY